MASSCSCRTFLGMEISTGKTQLLELIKIVDETMKEFNLSTFYKVKPGIEIIIAIQILSNLDII